MSEGHHVRRRQRLQPAADQRVLREQLAELLPPGCGGPAVRAAAAARKRAHSSRLVSVRSRSLNRILCAPQLNIMSFVSELLQWFEVKKPDFVQPVQATDLTGLEYQTATFLQYRRVLTSFSTSPRCLRVTRLYKSHQRERQQVERSVRLLPSQSDGCITSSFCPSVPPSVPPSVFQRIAFLHLETALHAHQLSCITRYKTLTNAQCLWSTQALTDPSVCPPRK